MSASREQYKGNDMLVLRDRDDDKFPFSFGVRKARLILAHLDDIRQFVTENEQ
jgi:hypothetical protein